MFRRFVMVPLVACALAAACGGSTESGSGGGGSGGSSGSSGSGGSGGGGIDCSAQDARSDGSECAAIAGFAWDGSSCQPIQCGCAGSDCDETFQTMAACQSAYGECVNGTPCGPTTCPVGKECCNASCGTCTDPGEGCTAIACEQDAGSPGQELCGHILCPQGTECCNSSCGTCVGPGGSCTDQACAPNCDAMDAEGIGDCFLALGYVWDGSECVMIGGCDCAGQDCDQVYPGKEICEQARFQCLPM